LNESFLTITGIVEATLCDDFGTIIRMITISNSTLYLKNLEIPKQQNKTNTTKIRKIDYTSTFGNYNNNKESNNQTYSNEINNNFQQHHTQNEFRKHTNDSHNNSRHYNNSNNTSNIYSTNNKYSYISLREEIERLKIVNQVLSNSNTELKNENANLNKEIELHYQVNRNSLENLNNHNLNTPFKRNSSRKSKLGDN